MRGARAQEESLARSDVQEIADLFGEALQGPFHQAYKMVVFAILDWSEEKRFIGPFQQVFGD